MKHLINSIEPIWRPLLLLVFDIFHWGLDLSSPYAVKAIIRRRELEAPWDKQR